MIKATEVQTYAEFHGWITKTNLNMQDLLWKMFLTNTALKMYFYDIYFNLFSKAPINTSISRNNDFAGRMGEIPPWSSMNQDGRADTRGVNLLAV